MISQVTPEKKKVKSKSPRQGHQFSRPKNQKHTLQSVFRCWVKPNVQLAQLCISLQFALFHLRNVAGTVVYFQLQISYLGIRVQQLQVPIDFASRNITVTQGRRQWKSVAIVCRTTHHDTQELHSPLLTLLVVYHIGC